MIIVKDVPGIDTADLLHLLSDLIPISEIRTGSGGVVLDERVALLFLQQYVEALDAIEGRTTGVTEPVTLEEAESTPIPKRRGRPPKMRGE